MRKFGTALAALGGLFALQAQADVLTFNDIAPTEAIQTSLVTGGFLAVSDHFHTYGPHPLYTNTSYSGSTTLGFEGGRGEPVTLTRMDGAAFDLLSFDGAEFWTQEVNNSDRPNANILSFTGFFAGGGSVTASFTLDGLSDGAGGVEDFQHFVLPNAFVNITSILLEGFLFSGAGGGVAVDNLEYTLYTPSSSVPEPATLALLGLGLAGVGIARRRKLV